MIHYSQLSNIGDGGLIHPYLVANACPAAAPEIFVLQWRRAQQSLDILQKTHLIALAPRKVQGTLVFALLGSRNTHWPNWAVGLLDCYNPT